METLITRPAARALSIIAVILGALGIIWLVLALPSSILVGAVLGIGATAIGVSARNQSDDKTPHHRVARLGIVLGVLAVGLTMIAMVLPFGLGELFVEPLAGNQTQVIAGESPSSPVAQSDPEGEYELILTEVRFYRGTRWEQYYKEHYPAHDMMFIYPDVILRNNTESDLTFVPVEQFWLRDDEGRIFDFSIGFAIPAEYEPFVDYPDPLGEPTITLPAQSEMSIFLETEISQYSTNICLIFDPDSTQSGEEIAVAIPKHQ
jgi:hypothetical protein